MNELFDLRLMLQELKADDKVHKAKPVLLTQKEIVELREKLNRVKRERSHEP